jgi:hypothetical protein
VDDEVVNAFARLVPQLRHLAGCYREELQDMVASRASIVWAHRHRKRRHRWFTHPVVFRFPTGVRAWIEVVG